MRQAGVDVWDVIDAAATKPFGFMKFTPGPGLGGHCIPLDPHYLSWKMRTLAFKTRMIELASEINSEMPAFVVKKVADALNEERKAVNGSRVLVLGVAYKKDIDDLRESPAMEIIRQLQEKGAEVSTTIRFCPEIADDGHTPLAGSPCRAWTARRPPFRPWTRWWWSPTTAESAGPRWPSTPRW
jgi:UDP-N-acetyl-D-glucosamine dehydrogenase